jgi:hypothetical protein
MGKFGSAQETEFYVRKRRHAARGILGSRALHCPASLSKRHAGTSSHKTRAVDDQREDLARPEIRNYVKATRPGRSFQYTNEKQPILPIYE